MKTIQLELSDKAFKAINNALSAKISMTSLDYALLKVIEHIEERGKVVTIQSKVDKAEVTT